MLCCDKYPYWFDVNVVNHASFQPRVELGATCVRVEGHTLQRAEMGVLLGTEPGADSKLYGGRAVLPRLWKRRDQIRRVWGASRSDGLYVYVSTQCFWFKLVFVKQHPCFGFHAAGV